MGEAKRWCFTLNNYTEDEYKEIVEKIEWTYIIIGREKGAEGTPHLQGYIELKTRRKLGGLKKVNTKIHWEQLKGKPYQAAEYCKKEGAFQEWGTISMKAPGEPKEKPFGSTVDSFLRGGMRAVMEQPPKLNRLRLLEKWATYLEPTRNEKPFVHWIWGASGTGKSRLASEYEDSYWKDDTKWWDGYDRQQTVILDDFRAHQMRFTYLLRLLDRYPLRVEVKGGYRQMNSKNIVITSIVHPESIYSITDSDEPLKQLIRRIDKITETNEKNIFLSCDEVIAAAAEKSVGNTEPHFSFDVDLESYLL